MKPKGKIFWIDCDGSVDYGELIGLGIRNDNDFSIDCKFQLRNYTLCLSSNDGIHLKVIGECSCVGDTWPIQVKLRRWKNAESTLLLGTWIEEGDESHCVIELFA